MKDKSCAILLPIKPQYANLILQGIKKYEFRKRLCKKEINTIYIYATAPVKQVIGEVEVVEKLIYDKEQLWQKTKSSSGLSYSEYQNYFCGMDIACAYRLGEYVLYDVPKSLEDYGINYTVQSFAYIEE